MLKNTSFAWSISHNSPHGRTFHTPYDPRYTVEWFKWIMFHDETAPFPDDVLKLGHYLGPSIDISPAMTAKILTENGQVLHRSTCRWLTPDELLDKDRSNDRDQFMAGGCETLGSRVLPK